MRVNSMTRIVITLAIAITAGLSLVGCTRGSRADAPHPAPHDPNAVSDVRTILAAIQQDPCSTAQVSDYADCEGRYTAQVTQIANTALAAATRFADPGHVRNAAQKLVTTSTQFQKLTCSSAPDRRCSTALHAVDNNLAKLSEAVNPLTANDSSASG